MCAETSDRPVPRPVECELRRHCVEWRGVGLVIPVAAVFHWCDGGEVAGRGWSRIQDNGDLQSVLGGVEEIRELAGGFSCSRRDPFERFLDVWRVVWRPAILGGEVDGCLKSPKIGLVVSDDVRYRCGV